MTLKEVLKLDSVLQTSPQLKVDDVDEKPGADVNSVEDEQAKEGTERLEINDTTAPSHDEYDKRQEPLESWGQDGEKSDVAELTGMLIDEAGGEDGVRGEKAGEAKFNADIMDSAEMCYAAVVLPMLPPEGTREVQEPPLEYTEVYMSGLGERDPVLISTVSGPSSPSTFFQASNIDVSGSNAVVDAWGDLPSTREETVCGTPPSSSDDASPGGGNSIEERAFVDSLCEEPLKADSVKEDARSSEPPSPEHGTTRFEPIQSSVVSDLENEYLAALSGKEPEKLEGRIPVGGVHSRKDKEKVPVEDLSLKSVLSDPITGAFLDDAMVAMCGHSFGSGGLQRVLETHVCASCGACVSPPTLVPNLALRAAVLAYKHEDQLSQQRSTKTLKRRREQFELSEGSEPKGITKDHVASAENNSADGSRPKGVQFPFSVSNRVLIKGNKRTPERFVGMEAVITSQCLNGWYLVRTMDTGESVRLQYRSLQKLGEIDSSEARLSVKQRPDMCGSPRSIGSPTGLPSVIEPASDAGLKSGLLTGQHDPATALPAYASTDSDGFTAYPSERESNAALRLAVTPDEAESSPNLSAETPLTSQQLPADQEARKSNDTTAEEDLLKPLYSGDEFSNGNLQVGGQEESFDAVIHSNGVTDVTKNMTSNLVESDDGELLRTGLQHNNGAKVWIGTDMCGVEVSTLTSEQLPQQAMPTGTDEDAKAGKDLSESARCQQNGQESLRTRSKRTALHFKTASEGFLRDPDPYRKVYSSGSRRRSGKLHSALTATADHVSADSKSSIKGSSPIGKASEKPSGKGLIVGAVGGGKQGRDKKLRSANEILQIMRKDMLKLEEQIPRNYVLRLWRSRRVKWRKLVKESFTVLELGARVRDFRYSLLLTTAGGMSDEEWEMRIALIIESGDVELLVSLWGRLYSDVYKWLENRSLAAKGDEQLGRVSTDDAIGLNNIDPDVGGGAMSSVHMTTAATIAAIDAVGDGLEGADASIQALLASTTKLLHQQSHTELLTVREALDREKRHIAAKLAHLEGNFGNLRWSLEPDRMEDDSLLQTTLRSSPSTVPVTHGATTATSLPSKQDNDAEDHDSDSVLPIKDPDGEATDMSDSD